MVSGCRHIGKRSSGVSRSTQAPSLVECGVEVQHGHEGTDVLQRSDGVGIVEVGAQHKGTVVLQGIQGEGGSGLDSLSRKGLAGLDSIEGCLIANRTIIDVGHLRLLVGSAYLDAVEVASVGVVDLNVDSTVVVGRSTLGQRPVLPGVGSLSGRLESLANLVGIVGAGTGIEGHATGIGRFVRLSHDGDLLTDAHFRDDEAVETGRGTLGVTATEPQVLRTGIVAQSGRIVNGKSQRTARGIGRVPEKACRLGNYCTVGSEFAINDVVAIRPEADVATRCRGTIGALLNVRPAATQLAFCSFLNEVGHGCRTPAREVPLTIALCAG